MLQESVIQELYRINAKDLDRDAKLRMVSENEKKSTCRGRLTTLMP